MKYFIAGKKALRLSNMDMITGASVILIGIFLLCYAIPAEIPLGFASKSGMSPKTLPFGVAVLMVICGLKVLYDGYRQKKNHDKAAAERGIPTEKMVSFYTIFLVICIMGFIGTALIHLLGYPIVNIALMMAMYYLSGGKSVWAALALGVVFTICSVLLFSYCLQLSIPFGAWV